MKSLGFVFKYARRHVVPLAVTVVSMVLLVGVQLFAPWIVKTMIATATGARSSGLHHSVGLAGAGYLYCARRLAISQKLHGTRGRLERRGRRSGRGL